MAGNSKTQLVLAGVLASTVVLSLGFMRSQAEAQAEELPQRTQQGDEKAVDPAADELQNEPLQRHGELPPDGGTREAPGTGGAGDAGSPLEDEDTFEEPGTGGAGDEGLMDEPGLDEGLDHQDETLDTGEGTREQPEGD